MTAIDVLLTELKGDAPVRQVLVGAFWTAVVLDSVPPRCGLASTLRAESHDKGPPVRQPGHLRDHSGRELAEWLHSPRILEASIGMAAVNALLDVDETVCTELNAEEVIIQGSNFDPNIEAQLQRTEQDQPATQTSTVTGSKSSVLSAGVAQNLKFGADYRFGFGMNRFEQTGPNVFVPLQYTSGFNVVFNMPILKGFGTTVTTENLVLARNNYNISRGINSGHILMSDIMNYFEIVTKIQFRTSSFQIVNTFL